MRARSARISGRFVIDDSRTVSRAFAPSQSRKINMPFPFLNSAKKTDAAPVKKKPVDDGPIINPEADKILGRMTVQTFVFTMTALILLTVVMPFYNQPPTAHHPASTVWKNNQFFVFG